MKMYRCLGYSILVFALMGCASLPSTELRSTIRTTSNGIPHVVADDYAGVGFGAGYAFACDAICETAGRFVTVNAQRSRYFGPDEREPDILRVSPTNLENDFFWQRILDDQLVERELALPEPLSPNVATRELVRGYVAGYNKYLADTGVANLPDPRCRGAAWVRPITEKDVWLRAMHWNLYRSSGSLIPALVNAAPPSATSALPDRKTLKDAFAHLDKDATGSNMIAFGSQATDNGLGMMFANPHWYWEGPERWYEIQLTIPGKLNVTGVQTMGVPVIQTGFTEKVAWAGTSSFANRYTPYELKLVPGSPTSYLYDGQVREMISKKVTVEVKTAKGGLEKRTHTFWETHYGPMFTDKDFVWNTTTGYAMRDVGYSFRWVSQQFELNHAQSVSDISEGGKKYMAIGWRNLAAADSTGKVFYGDRTAVPHVTDEKIKSCVNSERGKKFLNSRRLVVLDGSRSECEWGTDSDAPVSGIFSAHRLPELSRNDYVAQSNDTHWANNARQLLEGYPMIMGAERTTRTLRTRNGLQKVERRLAGTDGYPGNKFTLDLMAEITMNNHVYTAEIWQKPVVKLCQSLPKSDGVSAACPIIEAWDGTENLDSKGALLWRRFVERLVSDENSRSFGAHGAFFTIPFNPADPINTPAGLDTKEPKVAQALKMAVTDLTNSGIPLNAAIREYQYKVAYNEERLPVHGGGQATGQYNLVFAKDGFVEGKGYPNVNAGSSFIMFMQFTPQGPVGRSIMTYSQSPDPNSPYYKDQTLMYAQKRSKQMLFKEADILADPKLKVEELCVRTDNPALKCH
jgi:acyl-homoserine-lactone acylase